ncbi:hypothetical protein CDL12_08042 [Handroanthus impetiginosus]|uniref:DUF1995 domain-containing protein n=1 Tax=Handroanthus impetiginosus TaxID=429701 RepID=A0A2G9HP06_9LAMI|nr:hypothetical protein CDL12_08042 [Handroanthus impetiginosus]
MASKLLQIPVRTTKTPKPFCNFKRATALSLSFSFAAKRQQQQLICFISYKDEKLSPTSKISRLLPKCTLSSPNPLPPTTKEEAILQAKTSLSSALEKPLNNPKLTGKLKKLKQPRFRVEIPVIDDSPSSLSQLALQVFGEMPLRRKASKIKILLLWAKRDLTEAAIQAFGSHSSVIVVQNLDISSVLDEDIRTVNSADVAVFLAPETCQLGVMKTVTESLYPRPVVIFNPKWAFEEEVAFGDMSGFVESFDVVYSFMGLEVRGILSKRKGVVFKCVKDGVLSGEKWNVLVEEEGELRVV